ncbi:tetratricopeptide repeat protein [Tropicimonas sp. S265A]|uniref:tetratricopeptide repeat protein n=1 Tax=Tropicimonas sp. S265A TaxID=3415134 RepID=UPI003C7C788C
MRPFKSARPCTLVPNALALALAFLGSAALADSPGPHEMVMEDHGTHNPEELSLKGALARLKIGTPTPMDSALGYGAAKAGMHEEAREIFTDSANRGNVQGMTWLSWMEDNGLAGPEDPEAAAEWDRRAAELGSEVAMFNYGLDLLRGRGVPRDVELGRQVIRKAADLGEPSAQALIAEDWDLDAVTPDADAWKYDPLLY